MQVNIVQALAQLHDKKGELFARVMEQDSVTVEIYRPIKVDHQTPHLQNELYVIIRGSGEFLNDGRRSNFNPGEILYVPAGIEHRFEKFSDDFLTWVIFFKQ